MHGNQVKRNRKGGLEYIEFPVKWSARKKTNQHDRTIEEKTLNRLITTEPIVDLKQLKELDKLYADECTNYEVHGVTRCLEVCAGEKQF